MIVKMTILRLLGSSDDKEKEKISVARPEGHASLIWLVTPVISDHMHQSMQQYMYH